MNNRLRILSVLGALLVALATVLVAPKTSLADPIIVFEGEVKASELGPCSLNTPARLTGDATLVLDSDISFNTIDCRGYSLTITGTKALTLKANAAGDEEKGIFDFTSLTISGGSISAQDFVYAILSERPGATFTMTDGSLSIQGGDRSATEYLGVWTASDDACAITVTGGTIQTQDISSALVSTGTIDISGGQLELYTSDNADPDAYGQAIHSDGALTIYDCDIEAYGTIDSDVKLEVGDNVTLMVTSGAYGMALFTDAGGSMTVQSHIVQPAGGAVGAADFAGGPYPTVVDADGDPATLVQLAPMVSLDDATIGTVADQAYTGESICPTPTVAIGDKVLVAGVDYFIKYVDNVEPGIATIHFQGNEAAGVKGTRTVSFRIIKKVAGIPMFRLYNPYTGEHHYTASAVERDAISAIGWSYEGVGWIAPAEGGEPVYRLYNAYADDHHYTLSAEERDAMVSVGWTYEGVGWLSSPEGVEGNVPVWREYNPYARTGAHNFTTSMTEHVVLCELGWRGEGVGWYGIEG